jgi:FkbM family methyltransferase
MTWRTNAWVVAARDVARTLGLNKKIAAYLHGVGYETRYDSGLQATLEQGDCVWDVGANVGYYTRQFSERVGSKGIVFAFEPSPVNFARLDRVCAALNNVRLVQSGLGREDGKMAFQQGGDDLGATSRVIESAEGDVVVDIRSGMSLIRSGDASPPNAIKIDVEGFEYEVLMGLGEILGSASLRAVGVEVHFGILKDRGMTQAPQEVERLLQRHGFIVNWPDNSHILAFRRR